MSSIYATIRTSMNSSETINSRVEVNQRALIDKILARYASANAVYRELMQNSNDAEATKAEIYFQVNDENVVTQVLYRNNGMPFRPQDWSRLQKIAEGNPDPAKVGAFGVGAYSMFSICEEPMVISGSQALAFVWKGDALWSKIATQPTSTEWTSFCLPSRDPYQLPDLVEFGQFLCANLTFTQCLKEIQVLINNKKVLLIAKRTIEEPKVIQPPKATSWWKSDGAVTATNLFSLQSGAIWELRQEIYVQTETSSSKITARYVSATAKTKIPLDIAKRMERVTKKAPPPTVSVQILLADEAKGNPRTDAERITASFSPELGGRGRVFIGFRTSQTTGLAAHLQAPLIPTVEREAIDLQDTTLKVYNTELLNICGMILRLTLEHAMASIGQSYVAGKDERDKQEKKLLEEGKKSIAEEKVVDHPTKTEANQPETSSSSILSFARYMAIGVTKQIVSVLSSVDSSMDDGTLLNPRDPIPLCKEERQAIALMQAFCPEQSTPDSQVGTALAQGFSACLPNFTPPVLTKDGVVREGRLPNLGIESFVPQSCVIRKLVYQNAPEYHDVLCQCRKLTIDDLLVSLSDQVLDREKAIHLVQWWMKFKVKEPTSSGRSATLKDAIRFYNVNASSKVDSFKRYVYIVSNSNLKDMPIPDTVLPRDLHDSIGKELPRGWFADLPMDVWAHFIAHSAIMTEGKLEDEKLRIGALLVLCKEWKGYSEPRRSSFGQKLKQLLEDKRCIPCESESAPFGTERPGDLYLNTAELKAFASVENSFQKVSAAVHDAGVTDDFLILLGVRKSVAIEFLFSHLDTLRWSDDPKPLVEYLRSSSLTHDDLVMLQTSQYLPAENDVSRTFAPKELHLPNPELRLFRSVRLLQWPSDYDLTPKSANGQFLVSIGMKTHPDLLLILTYISEEVHDSQVRVRCLSYVAKHLSAGGAYERQFRLLSKASLSSLKIMPCVVKDVFVPSSQQSEVQSPLHCYSDPGCFDLGFRVVDPSIDTSNRFRVPIQPETDLVLSQLMHLVSSAKTRLLASADPSVHAQVRQSFEGIFSYMSQRSNDFTQSQMGSLKQQQFIPCLVNGIVEWFEPENVYFKNSSESSDKLTSSLFHIIEFSPFLAAAGVKSEASTADLFSLLLKDANRVLKTLGSEDKYRAVLRRIAANPPFQRITPQIRAAPFLLAYNVAESEDNGSEILSYVLAKPEDIFLVDNSFFGRMFPVLRAPHESDLEAFYATLGSQYISKVVNKSFQILGSTRSATDLAGLLADRLEERRPLLVSPSVASRPLVANANDVIDASKLKIFEVDSIKAVYSLKGSTRNQRVTCCAKSLSTKVNGLYVTDDFDWFDVGYAIGGLILQRCQLEDAFFIGSILEAPLDQLRSRGFPVDRIIVPPDSPKTTSPIVSEPPAALPNKLASPSFSQETPTQSSTMDSSRVDGIFQIMKQMFPKCDDNYIRQHLEKDSSMESVRRFAEDMTENGYPTQDDLSEEKAQTEHLKPTRSPSPPKQAKLSQRLGQVFSGIRGGVRNVAPNGPDSQATPVNRPITSSSFGFHNGLQVQPEMDATSHSNLEQMLKSSVDRSAQVNPKGVNSVDTVYTQLPEGLNRNNDGCEIIPGQSLKAFPGPYRSNKTYNGIRVFSARQHLSSETFLRENFHAVDNFADVLKNLCGVYQLSLTSVAIYHDPSGGTIAFNANRALHFNVRFFHSLHYDKPDSIRQCYAYWFTTFAHELAHHLVSHHNKEHGFYTESYVTLYLPKLVITLTQLEVENAEGKSAALRSKFV